VLHMGGYTLPDLLFYSNNFAISAVLAQVCALLSAILVVNVFFRKMAVLC